MTYLLASDGEGAKSEGLLSDFTPEEDLSLAPMYNYSNINTISVTVIIQQNLSTCWTRWHTLVFPELVR